MSPSASELSKACLSPGPAAPREFAGGTVALARGPEVDRGRAGLVADQASGYKDNAKKTRD